LSEFDSSSARDCETSYITLDPADDSALNDLLGHSITYRVAVGPRAGEKVFTVQTVHPGAQAHQGFGPGGYA
jgi:hypothetical protein